MKYLITLAFVLTACGKSGSSASDSSTPAGNGNGSVVPGNDTSVQPVDTPVAPLPPPVDPEYGLIMSGTYSSQGLWCDGLNCNQAQEPKVCSDLTPGTIFNDFTMNVEMLYGYFYGSVPENVSLDEQSRTITLIANVTGHVGKVVGYQYLRDSNQWIVTYAAGCSRLYELVP